MATLVLTAVGTAIGGPIGGMIGALVGQQIDAQIFKPKGRQGPRLGDLTVQTSSYGSAIPKLFGTMRVAGTVIWSTDLQEQESASGGGKGRPKTTLYSYSASFAVALSGRPIRSVKRIWADGKLLRGAAEDFKSETGFRFYSGGEDQPVDPLIGAAEGEAPAFRGIAYAVFEDFQLEDYGNRIPSLTFEVEADAGGIAIGAMAEELSDGRLRDAGTPELAGFAALGDSVRSAVEALAQTAPLSLRDDGEMIFLAASRGAIVDLAEPELGASGAGGIGGRSEFARKAAGAVPGEVSITHHDPARDYQTGLQRATSGGGQGREERIALPVVLSAGAAKGMAERRLAELGAARATAKIHLGWRRVALRPGRHVRVEERGGVWRIGRWTLERMVLSLELVRVRSEPVEVSPEADPGRPIGHPDLLHGPTTVHLLDLPLYDEPPARPRLLAAAAGAEAGWRRAVLLASFDGGASWSEAGSTAAPAVIGHMLTTLATGGAALFDESASIEVELLSDAKWLESRNDAALAAGDNLAAIGGELIQFGRADPLGERRFRLSRLLRGRRGTEWAMEGHQPHEPFVLIDRTTLAVLEPPVSAAGQIARLSASGRGDATPGTADCLISGEALRPPPPVHLTAVREANGDIRLNWVRRSRAGWAWLDGGDVPLAEEREAYRLTLTDGTFARTVDLSAPAFVYPAADQAEDGMPGAFSASVVQLGTWAASRPAEAIVSV